MKYIFLFLISFPLFARTVEDHLLTIQTDNIKNDLRSSKYLIVKKSGDGCKERGYSRELVMKCIFEINRLAENIWPAVEDVKPNNASVEKAEEVGQALFEIICTSHYRTKLESLNVAYLVGDTCAQLKARVP